MKNLFSRCYLVFVAVLLAGCNMQPKRLDAPDWQPDAMAAATMQEFDGNSDGQLDASELKKSESLAKSLSRLDSNKDKKLSLDEVRERFSMWANGSISVSPYSCLVTKGGKPLGGATVKFVPESFLNGVVHPAEGITDASGHVDMSIDKTHLPADLQRLRAIQQGFYRVEITHPSEGIPEKFNTSTSLGLFVSFETGGTTAKFDL